MMYTQPAGEGMREAYMNTVSLMGRLTADPDVRQTAGGMMTARFILAVDRNRTKDGKQETDFIRCVEFGKSAEFAGKFLRKGMKIAVIGSIRTGSYTDRDGKTVYTTEVLVNENFFCERKADQSGALSDGREQSYQPQVQGQGYQNAPSPAPAFDPSDFEEVMTEGKLPF